MAATYTCEVQSTLNGVVTIRIGFGEPAANDRIVPDALRAIDELELQGGRGIKFDGPASLPVAMALAHAVAHRFGFVACRDPKLERYVVAISHDPSVRPGDLME
jgi:CRISPR-associated protein Csx3